MIKRDFYCISLSGTQQLSNNIGGSMIPPLTSYPGSKKRGKEERRGKKRRERESIICRGRGLIYSPFSLSLSSRKCTILAVSPFLLCMWKYSSAQCCLLHLLVLEIIGNLPRNTRSQERSLCCVTRQPVHSARKREQKSKISTDIDVKN